MLCYKGDSGERSQKEFRITSRWRQHIVSADTVVCIVLPCIVRRRQIPAIVSATKSSLSRQINALKMSFNETEDCGNLNASTTTDCNEITDVGWRPSQRLYTVGHKNCTLLIGAVSLQTYAIQR